MKLTWRPMTIGGGPAILTSITDKESRALGKLAREAAGRGIADVLEVGSAYGYSAVVMARELAGQGAHVTAVDPHTWLNSLHAALAHFTAYGVLDRVAIDQRTSFDALPEYFAAGRRFGLIFVDGDHVESAVEHDVTWAVKLLAKGGVLACHDYGEATCPGVRAALDRVLGAPEELVDTLAIYRGLA